MKTYLLLCTLPILTIIACNQPQTRVAHEQWFSNTKAEILRQATAEPDSTAFSFSDDRNQREQAQFIGHHLLSKKGFDHDVLRYEIYFSKDGMFQFRRDYHQNGRPAFEGILYNNDGYGLTTRWLENGREQSYGVRFAGKPVGEWRMKQQKGMKSYYQDYGGTTNIEKFPVLKKM
ncbi:hypothetical protein [Chitinophaga jiangningensis]|nr:hypothetical protein [Chitinophaga jiangningensis]